MAAQGNNLVVDQVMIGEDKERETVLSCQDSIWLL